MKINGLVAISVLLLLFIVKNLSYAGELVDAAQDGDVAKVRQLLEYGKNVSAIDLDYALYWAVHYKKNEVVKLLLEKGGNPNYRDTNEQWTLLHEAAKYGNIDAAKLLIEKGADVNLKDSAGDTPDVVAEQENYPELADLIRKQSVGSVMQRPIPQEARDEMTKGMVAFKLAKRPEDFAEAEAHFSSAQRMAPWLPEPYFDLALARGQQHKFHDATDSLKRYLAAVTDPRDIQVGKQKMAELDLHIRRYDDFRDETNAGLEATEKGPNGYNEAIEHLRKAIKIYNDHPQVNKAYYGLGDVYMRQGDLDEAYKNFQKAFELVPEPSDWPFRYTNMGFVLERRGDWHKACIYYKKGCDHGSKVGCDNYRSCP